MILQWLMMYPALQVMMKSPIPSYTTSSFLLPQDPFSLNLPILSMFNTMSITQSKYPFSLSISIAAASNANLGYILLLMNMLVLHIMLTSMMLSIMIQLTLVLLMAHLYFLLKIMSILSTSTALIFRISLLYHPWIFLVPLTLLIFFQIPVPSARTVILL